MYVYVRENKNSAACGYSSRSVSKNDVFSLKQKFMFHERKKHIENYISAKKFLNLTFYFKAYK